MKTNHEQDLNYFMQTSESRMRPSSLQMCIIRLPMISSESGLNLNFAHLEARGSIILQNNKGIDQKQQGISREHKN